MPRLKPRVRLERPSASREREFLAAALRSRALHRGYVVAAATRSEYRRYLRSARCATREGFFVVETESRELAGVINIHDIVRDPELSGRLGYYAFVPHAGKGAMRDGLALVIAQAFRELGLRRLEAHIEPRNSRSIALVEGLGFTREGNSRGFLKIGTRWRGHWRFALSKEEWLRERAQPACARA